MEGENREKEFTVHDRRIFSSETSGDSSEPRAEQSERSDTDRTEESSPDQTRTEPFPELDFSAFILSLATSAQVGLGAVPNPQTSQSEQNLPVAKQMIDLLGLLKDKTKGNLSPDEQALLDTALFNLRMQYVKALKGKK